MKQIYRTLDWLGKYYNYLILFIFIISILILVLNNNENTTLWKFYETQEDYDIGNGIWNNILTGLICSAVFYWLVQYIPDKRKEDITKELIQHELDVIITKMDNFLSNYRDIYIPDKEIEDLNELDFEKIKFLEIRNHNHINPNSDASIFNYTIKQEMLNINNFAMGVYNDLAPIVKNPYINNIPKLLIFIYKFKETGFHEFINSMYHVYNDNIILHKNTNHPIAVDFDYRFKESDSKYFIKYMKSVFILRTNLKNFTSSSSKQSS